jgi:hypothetical protein
MKRRFSIMLFVLVIGAVSLVIAQGRSQGQGEAWDTDEVVTLDGVLTEVERPYATMKSGDLSYVVHLGPPWYWDKAGFEVNSGDEISINGQISRDGDEIHLYPHTIVRGDDTLRLADENGVPVWSGRGSAQQSPPPPAAGRGKGRGCCGGCAKGAGNRYGMRQGRGPRWNS